MQRGKVKERINRFLVSVISDDNEIRVHLHDPGRLTELIYPGNDVIFRKTNGLITSHSVIAAEKAGRWILTDSRYHNAIVSRFLKGNWRSEVRLGDSRIDFYASGHYIEVKGCSLEVSGIAMFPDAPSARASKHVNELRRWVESGGKADIVILVFSPDAEVFSPNTETDPEFGKNLARAISAGVKIHVLKFSTTESGIRFIDTVNTLII